MGCFRCRGASDLLLENKHVWRNDDNVASPATINKTSRRHSNRFELKRKVVASIRRSKSNIEFSTPREEWKEETTAGKQEQTFTFDELAAATGNFRPGSFIGDGGFGKVCRGYLERINQVVWVLRREGSEVAGLRVYAARIFGSHLHDFPSEKKGLDWGMRMRIAAGAARGLQYLHEKMKPPIIYRHLKCSNILLNEGYHPKLSDFGLAKVGPSGDKTHVSTRVMGTYAYCAPDYAMTGQLTFKSHIYSFGVLLLELVTGRKAFDQSKDVKEHNIVAWARPLFRDRSKFAKMADPKLEGKFPMRSLYQVLAIAAMCVQEQPNMRPAIGEVLKALDYLSSKASDQINAVTAAVNSLSVSNSLRREHSRIFGGDSAGVGGLSEFEITAEHIGIPDYYD